MEKPNKKKPIYEKKYFSDEEIVQEIKHEIRQIEESKIDEAQKYQKIFKLYDERKQLKKRKKMIEKGGDRKLQEKKKEEIDSQSGDEPGQINQQIPRRRQRESNEQQLNKQEFGELIKQITLTRKRLIEFLDNRKFEDLVRGCFVRYKCDSTSKQQLYMIAQIIGVKQGNKQYVLTSKHKTRNFLIIQESSIKIVELPIEMVSNQVISGSIEITRWIEQNGDKIPKQKHIKEKLEQHNRLLNEQLSSHQIDMNILNRAVALSKGQQEIKSLEDLQNLLDFIVEKYQGYQMLEEEEVAKRKLENLDLMEIRRKKTEYKELKKSLENKKKQYLENKRTSENKRQNNGYNKPSKGGSQTLKIEQKREDSIKQKWKLRQMLLCTAQGYERIKMNLVQNHKKYELEFDF